MVHALLEIWRVLASQGSLIDLRPIHDNPPLAVVTAAGRHSVGYVVDETGGVDDRAADEAMAGVVRRGYFTAKMRDSFEFAAYWETLPELLDYADKRWRGKKHLPPQVLDLVRKYINQSDGRARISLTNTIQLAVYQKMKSPSDRSS